jgi:hypothetical protein
MQSCYVQPDPAAANEWRQTQQQINRYNSHQESKLPVTGRRDPLAHSFGGDHRGYGRLEKE